jgi:hypothetical protein
MTKLWNGDELLSLGVAFPSQLIIVMDGQRRTLMSQCANLDMRSAYGGRR